MIHKAVKPLVSVCVCTYKRPELLYALLESLSVQKYDGFYFEVVVVDNDAFGSAERMVDKAKIHLPALDIKYAIEPEQGISFARNKTVGMASGELIAFIDDDESAAPDWLNEAFKCLAQYKADAVLGPVLPVYPDGSKKWVIESRYFERPRFVTGTFIHGGDARTGNAFIKADWCRKRLPEAFEARLAQTGGEDSDFFRWVENEGGRLCWCDSAVVSEIVPFSRQRLGFMLKRRLRSSTGYWRSIYDSISLGRSVAAGFAGGIGGIAYLFIGCCMLPLGLPKTVRMWSKSMNGFGRVLAFLNVQPIGYGADNG